MTPCFFVFSPDMLFPQYVSNQVCQALDLHERTIKYDACLYAV